MLIYEEQKSCSVANVFRLNNESYGYYYSDMTNQYFVAKIVMIIEKKVINKIRSNYMIQEYINIE